MSKVYAALLHGPSLQQARPLIAVDDKVLVLALMGLMLEHGCEAERKAGVLRLSADEGEATEGDDADSDR